MKRIIRSLLPRDTRTIEIASAITLLFTSTSSFLGVTKFHWTLSIIHSAGFWTLMTFIFGVLQIYSLLQYHREEPLRIVTSWVAGSFFMWNALNSGLNTTGDIAELALGISCFVSFLINTIIMSERWKE